MKTELAPQYRDRAEAQDAEAIVQKCVHCGFCNATCPTYQLLGDELDGPRGRIYQIKQVLEGAPVTASTQLHLDRCLTCRACETTCPSGVEYGRLVDIGRQLVDEQVPSPLGDRAVRWMLKEGLTSPLFGAALAAGQAVRGLLPEVLARKVPPRQAHSAAVIPAASARRVLILDGCVQPALGPNIRSATLKVLSAAGIEAFSVPRAGCCGAIRQHLGDGAGALWDMRRNIDAWWPSIERGDVEAIVVNASGCSVAIKDYAHALRDDPAYAVRAARVTALARDLTELLPALVVQLKGRLAGRTTGSLVVHPPCTLQHGQRLGGVLETQLAALGFEVRLASRESQLCCGSAGTYSVLQPDLAYRLRDRKLEALGAGSSECIVSANIGCIQHLQTGTATPVRHWVEVLAEALD